MQFQYLGMTIIGSRRIYTRLKSTAHFWWLGALLRQILPFLGELGHSVMDISQMSEEDWLGAFETETKKTGMDSTRLRFRGDTCSQFQ